MTTRVMAGYVPFTFAQELFYDVLGSPDDTDPSEELVPQNAPAGWRRVRQGPWTVLFPEAAGPQGPAAPPSHGWKVHAAALPDQAADTVAHVLAVCHELGVAVKALRTRRTVLATQLKYAPEWAAGKVVTAYPLTLAVAAALLDALIPRLAGRPAPKVLGEIAIAGAPLSLRHGAFAAGWCRDDDGRLRPGWTEHGRRVIDLRGSAGAAGAPPLPEELRRFVTTGAQPRLDISDVALLHRTNGGAVYRARRLGGEIVVLKEARRHAGLDQGGVDALTRLRHEHAVLRRLSGTGLVPEVLDLIEADDSEFLVLEHVPGRTLTAGLAADHPGCRPGAGAGAERDYTAWVERSVRHLHEAVLALARHGVVHGDLHPGNVLELPDRLVLVDLESAALDGHSVAHGVAVPGFSSGLNPTVDDDLAAVQRVRLSLLNPVAGVLPWRPELAAELLETGCSDALGLPSPAALSDPATSSAARTTHATSTMLARLHAGIAACASPARQDRLFPGDVAQFTVPGAALGLLHGAAGVCLALSASGAAVPPAWLDWLEGAARRPPEAGGLGHGLEGVALALALLGRPEAARAVGARAADAGVDAVLPPWWEYGHAGRALAFAELARLVGPEFEAPAQLHLEATLAAVDAGMTPPGTGLLQGWTGVALALTALGDLRPEGPDDSVVSDSDAAVCRRAALRAVSLELRQARIEGGALFLVDGGRLLPSLAVGGAGLGLAAAALRRRSIDRPEGLDGLEQVDGLEQIDGLDGLDGGPGLDSLVAAAVRTCRTPVVMSGGLALGRAGQLAVLRRLAGDDHPAVGEHIRRLDWHVVALSPKRRLRVGATDLEVAQGSTETPGPGVVSGSVNAPAALLGEASMRLSTDVATGSAGALLALLAAASDALHTVLRLPAATLPTTSGGVQPRARGRLGPQPVTSVSPAR